MIDRRQPPPAEKAEALTPATVGGPGEERPTGQTTGQTEVRAAAPARPLPRFSPQSLTPAASPVPANAGEPAAAEAASVAPPAVPSSPVTTVTGPRHRRRLSGRRRVVEGVVIVLVFLVALGVTVLFLASQWLLNASVTGTIGGAGAVAGLLLPTTSTST